MPDGDGAEETDKVQGLGLGLESGISVGVLALMKASDIE